jgi:hypothetical protein
MDSFHEIPKEYLDRATLGQFAPSVPDDHELNNSPSPIAVLVTADEIAALYISNTSPDGFMQYLLGRLKSSGAAVEGAMRLRLAHGAVYKVKGEPGQMYFQYLWLPEAYVAGINAVGGVA